MNMSTRQGTGDVILQYYYFPLPCPSSGSCIGTQINFSPCRQSCPGQSFFISRPPSQSLMYATCVVLPFLVNSSSPQFHSSWSFISRSLPCTLLLQCSEGESYQRLHSLLRHDTSFLQFIHKVKNDSFL